MPGRILIADPDYDAQLRDELLHRKLSFVQIAEHIFQIEDCEQALVWPICEWLNPQTVAIDSIGHAAKILREHGPYWDHLPLGFARRSQLIQDKLLSVKNKAFTFPSPKPHKPRGAFCLTDKNTLLFAPQCTRPFVNGLFPFLQDRENPPARAYLKIWESLSILQEHPQSDEQVIELGAAPGAWTWCFAQTAKHVRSVDRAPLDPRIESLPNVDHHQGDAFAFPLDNCDWLCSDLICYPERLIELINDCLDKQVCEKFIITIKFQGKTDFDAVDVLQAIPHSWLIHLANNKNEVTWIRHPKITSNKMGPWNNSAS